TLTLPLTGGQILSAPTPTSIMASWNAVPASPQDQSAEGYLLQASTASNFTGTVFSSATYNIAANSLTVQLLQGGTTYARACSLNWNNVANCVNIGSVSTDPSAISPLTVASAGTAMFTSIQAAVNAIPAN